MALAGVLSAIRTLILDVDQFPSDVASRQKKYCSLFPELTQTEIEDLAKIEPDRIKTYTTSIFAGEANILKNHFKVTLALLTNIWPKVYSEELNYTQLTRKLHNLRPWKSNLTVDLASNFYQFLLNDVPELIEASNILQHIADLELTTLEIRRAEDDSNEVSVVHPYVFDENLQVSEFLSLNFSVPSCVRLKKYPYDVVQIYKEFNLEKREPAANLPEQLTFALGSRNQKKFVRWKVVPEVIFDALKLKSSATLSELAEVFVSASNTEQSEAEVFAQFLELVAALNRAGIISVKN